MMTKISEVFELQMGKTPSRKNLDYWIDGNTDWVSISDLGTYEKYVGKTKEKITQQAIDESGIKAVPKNTVLMSFKLSIGISAITREEKTYTNEAIMAFIDKGEKSLFPDYFYHQFRTKDWLENTSKAVMGSTLNKSKLSNCIIKVPDLDEQKHVASVLDAVCRLILIKEDLCKKLDDLVKSRFVETFGDPCDVKSGKFPMEEIGSFCELTIGPFGSALHKEDYIDGGHPVINPSHIVSGRIVPNTKLTVGESKFASMKPYHLHKGDVVLGRRGEIGRCAVVTDEGLLCGTGSMILRPKKSLCRSDYLQRVVSFPAFAAALGREAVGVTMKNLNIKIVGNSSVVLPPLSLQQEFADFVTQVDKLKFDFDFLVSFSIPSICLFCLKLDP